MADFNVKDTTEEKRRRQMAILRASNEMLRQAKETALSKIDDPIRREELAADFDKSLYENSMQANSYLHTTIEEVEKTPYREVDPSYVEKYKKRLEKKGLTEEELKRKESATVTVGKAKKGNATTTVRRKRRGSKTDDENVEEYVKLENEEELMNSTRVKNDNDIEKHRQKNAEYEQNVAKRKNNAVLNAADKID